MKTVTINLPGSGSWKDLQIAPGTTARDVLAQVGLGADFSLVRWNSVNAFDDTGNLYQLVEDGEKLQAVTTSEVAASS